MADVTRSVLLMRRKSTFQLIKKCLWLFCIDGHHAYSTLRIILFRKLIVSSCLFIMLASEWNKISVLIILALWYVTCSYGDYSSKVFYLCSLEKPLQF